MCLSLSAVISGTRFGLPGATLDSKSISQLLSLRSFGHLEPRKGLGNDKPKLARTGG
jgi:hypothetical protein